MKSKIWKGKTMNTHSFEKKRVLVTGGYGFIGSHLIRRLLHEKAQVAVVVRETSNPWRIQDVVKDILVFPANIVDSADVVNVVKQFNPHYIFHLAAYGVNSAQKNYLEALQVNVLGTINIVNAARTVGCEKIINLGSSSEYGDKSERIHENMTLEPVDIYGSTKAAATILAHQMSSESKMPIVTLRPFGVFGEGEDPHKLFGHIIQCMLKNQDVELTPCEQYRDYCYVGNIVDGMVAAALSPSINNHIFNIASGEVQQLKYFVNLIFKHMNTSNKPLYGAISYRKNERNCPFPDISKIKTFLLWEPSITLEEGIIRTIDWYKQHKDLFVKK